MPLPPGFELEQSQQPKLPPGFEIEGQPKKGGLLSGILPPRNLGSQGQAALQDMQSRPWGSGVPHLAYGAGEKVSDAATGMGASPEVSAGLGYGTNVLTQAIPALATGKFAGEAAAPALQAGGRALMKSAVKPTLSDLQSGDAAKGIETMLKQGYSPTKGGVEAMQKRIGELGDEVTQAIANSTATINKNAVADRLRSAVDKFKTQVNPQADLAAIQKAWTEFLAHPDLAGKTDMSVQLAQAMKQGTYRSLGDKPYGELSGASTEAQKQLARGLKEEVSAAVPGVANANAMQGELMNAKSIAERRALMEGNKNPVSLGASIGAAMQNPMATIGLWANSSAAAKAALARMLYSGSERIPQAAGSAGGAALMAGSGKAPTDQELLAEALRKQKKLPPIREQMFSPEDASLPIAQR